eukprot:EC719172.1.p1 GENE.EC719172.1~~EC719172.1.p1  ORF type:complete len:109 (+),score=2.20 EC719172.1:89-415(+)
MKRVSLILLVTILVFLCVEVVVGLPTVYNLLSKASLRSLEEKCLLKKQGYWTFQYCHESHVTQFHLDTVKAKMISVHLGNFESAKLNFNRTRVYPRHLYANGRSLRCR